MVEQLKISFRPRLSRRILIEYMFVVSGVPERFLFTVSP